MAERQYYKRDELGRFAKEDRSAEIEQAKGETIEQLKKRLAIPLNFFASKKEKELSPERLEEIKSNIPKTAFGFSDKERLKTSHHTDHARQMGYKDQKSYEQGAIDFWQSGKGQVYYSPTRERYYKYDKRNKLFCAIDKDGIVRTFMVMDNKTFERKFVQEQLYDNL